ncbi:uncharacterized protein A4U43_C03F17420 [Asparagus officinalis]|uniref:Uncharacterized protein n=1 Tax=Asparagus officinalis TaxID=4686 RepID=A0A5P1FDP5_ASPOF|nr:uncharacterized protein A4U43_C03F17420 [Asparagus officinalis]
MADGDGPADGRRVAWRRRVAGGAADGWIGVVPTEWTAAGATMAWRGAVANAVAGGAAYGDGCSIVDCGPYLRTTVTVGEGWPGDALTGQATAGTGERQRVARTALPRASARLLPSEMATRYNRHHRLVVVPTDRRASPPARLYLQSRLRASLTPRKPRLLSPLAFGFGATRLPSNAAAELLARLTHQLQRAHAPDRAPRHLLLS